MRSISATTRKKLWALSCNRCAFPQCNTRLVEPDDAKGGCVIGEEAHIVAQKNTGPRGDEKNRSTLSSGINSYENLILLCPNHHKEIDIRPKKYSVTVLLSMKKEHEQRMEEMYARSDQSNSLRAHVLQYQKIKNHIDRYYPLSDIISFKDSFIIICAPEEIEEKNGRWLADLKIKMFHVQNGSCREIYAFRSALSSIEYWFSETKFYILRDTSINFRPFIKYEFDLSQFPAERKAILLPDIDPLHIGRIPEYMEEIKNISAKRYSERSKKKIDELIDNIWNAGLAQPDVAINGLKKLFEYPWCDGANAEELNAVLGELNLVKEIKQ